MTRVAMLVLVLLGYLAGCAESKTMDSEAAGRPTLQLVGLIVAAVLFYVAFSGAIMALFSRSWGRKRRGVEHHGLSEIAGTVRESGNEVHDAHRG
ncbi:MAG TPA: hypothetical protein VJX92_07435 [Methylomirabilota bacterium]|nr:hypothetical protein [Methylomirabilota bacterium]